jgi:hypothetical protein
MSNLAKPPTFSTMTPRQDNHPWAKETRILQFSSDLQARAGGFGPSAVLFLCFIYGMRGSEVVNLTLNDFGWVNETFTVRRVSAEEFNNIPCGCASNSVTISPFETARSLHRSCGFFFQSKKTAPEPQCKYRLSSRGRNDLGVAGYRDGESKPDSRNPRRDSTADRKLPY